MLPEILFAGSMFYLSARILVDHWDGWSKISMDEQKAVGSHLDLELRPSKVLPPPKLLKRVLLLP